MRILKRIIHQNLVSIFCLSGTTENFESKLNHLHMFGGNIDDLDENLIINRDIDISFLNYVLTFFFH